MEYYKTPNLISYNGINYPLHVTKEGYVYHTDTKEWINFSVKGKEVIRVTINGNTKLLSLSWVVVFVHNPKMYNEMVNSYRGQTLRHLDGNPRNNHVDNLGLPVKEVEHTIDLGLYMSMVIPNPIVNELIRPRKEGIVTSYPTRAKYNIEYVPVYRERVKELRTMSNIPWKEWVKTDEGKEHQRLTAAIRRLEKYDTCFTKRTLLTGMIF